VPKLIYIPPPLPVTLLPEIMLEVIVEVPVLYIPPPLPAVLLEIIL
jgi:hypothetical protein